MTELECGGELDSATFHNNTLRPENTGCHGNKLAKVEQLPKCENQ